MKADARGETQEISVVSNGEIAEATLSLIQSAESEVISMEFLLRDDEFGLAKLAALRRKAREGKKVVIHVDAFHLLVDPALLYHLIDEGIEFTIFNKLTFWNFPKMSYRNHCKFLIIDGKILKTGDTNTGNEYVHWDDEFHMKSIDVVMRGSLVKSAKRYAYDLIQSPWTVKPEYRIGSNEEVERQRKVIGRWIQATKIFFKILHVQMDAPAQITRPRCVLVTKEEVQNAENKLDTAEKKYLQNLNWKFQGAPVQNAQFYWDTIYGKHQFEGVEFSVENFIRSAQKSLKIVSPYLILTPLIKKAIASAVSRGIGISFYTNSLKSTDNGTTQLAYEYRMKEICKLGEKISIYEYEGPETLHAKFIIKDESECMIMSYNLDWRSQIKNLEAGLQFPDRQAAHKLEEWLLNHQEKFTLVLRNQRIYKPLVRPHSVKDFIKKWTILSIERHL